MFGKLRTTESSNLDEPITRVLEEMEVYGPNDPEYANMVEHLERLARLKAETRRQGVSPDTILIVVGNLMGVGLIVAYEQKHVISSKAMTFVKLLSPK